MRSAEASAAWSGVSRPARASARCARTRHRSGAMGTPRTGLCRAAGVTKEMRPNTAQEKSRPYVNEAAGSLPVPVPGAKGRTRVGGRRTGSNRPRKAPITAGMNPSDPDSRGGPRMRRGPAPAMTGTGRPLTPAPSGRDVESVRVSELLAALSFALDLTEGQPFGHALRSCLIGMRLAERLDLPVQDRRDLYYAMLLKDVGCSSNAARVFELFGGDDRAAKHALKRVDWTNYLVAARYAFTSPD